MIIEKPEKLEGGHLHFLDDLRDSGETNMFLASSYLQKEFSDLSKQEARTICAYWRKTFSERMKQNGRN